MAQQDGYLEVQGTYYQLELYLEPTNLVFSAALSTVIIGSKYHEPPNRHAKALHCRQNASEEQNSARNSSRPGHAGAHGLGNTLSGEQDSGKLYFMLTHETFR